MANSVVVVIDISFVFHAVVNLRIVPPAGSLVPTFSVTEGVDDFIEVCVEVVASDVDVCVPVMAVLRTEEGTATSKFTTVRGLDHFLFIQVSPWDDSHFRHEAKAYNVKLM